MRGARTPEGGTGLFLKRPELFADAGVEILMVFVAEGCKKSQLLQEDIDMFKPAANWFRRWSWAKTGSLVINLSVAAFVVACLMSRWSLAQAQDSPSKKAPTQTKQKQKAAEPQTRLRQVGECDRPGSGSSLEGRQNSRLS